MTRNPIRRLVLLSLLLPLSTIRAEEPALRDLLRDALYTEEVTRDPEKAAKQYEDLLARHDAQKTFAAAALFRLAEVRRKQDRKDDAIKFYQRLIAEFPGAETETKLAKENLAAMGGKIPEAGMAAVDDEEKELQRLKKLLETSPDLARSRDEVSLAVGNNRLRVVEWLLDTAKIDVSCMRILYEPASEGYRDMVNLLLSKARKAVLPDAPGALAEAARNGHLEVVRVLLAAGADVNWQRPIGIALPPEKKNLINGRAIGTPLMVSIVAGNRAVTDLLLASKADVKMPSTGTGFTPLHAAVANADADTPKLIERMIDLGADVNALSGKAVEGMPKEWQNISPLQYAVVHNAWDCAKVLIRRGADLKQPRLFDPFLSTMIEDGNLPKIRFLIENGADAKQPCLLGRLIARGPDEIPLIKALLEAGANPNALDSSRVPPIVQVFNWDLKNVGDGNQQSAEHWKQVELIQMLLKHGADPNTTYGEFSRNATRSPQRSESKYEASPFVEDTDKSESYPSSLLMKVVELEDKQNLRNVSLIKILLDAGAKPTNEFPEVFDFVAKGGDSLLIAKALLPFGPKTLNLNPSGYFLNWNPKVERLFLDEVLNPALAAKRGIHFVLAEQGGSKALLEEGQPIPATAELLLSALPSALTPSPSNPLGYSSDLSRNLREPVLTLVRRRADGKWDRIPIEWKGDDPLPQLQAGDIVEFSWGPVFSKDNGNNTDFANFLAWHFRKRISFPITLEIDGKARELRLRGDLLAFDPTKHEAPLLNAGPVVNLFLPNSEGSRSFARVYLRKGELVVKRKGWKDISLTLQTPDYHGFKLQRDDHLILNGVTTPEDFSNPKELGSLEAAVLLTPGHPFARVFGVSCANKNQRVTLFPTLVQAITDAYASTSRSGAASEQTGDPQPWYIFSSGTRATIPPRPDFSNIRIRRISRDGKETIIKVNLAEAIRRCAEATTPDEARKSDMNLQAGDLVELPLLDNGDGKPWSSFSNEETRFFQKVLGGHVIVNRGNGDMEQREIVYEPTTWRITPYGLLPARTTKGIPTMRLSSVSETDASSGAITRSEQGSYSQFYGRELDQDPFVRDGDQIDLQGGVSRPAPRVVPPPAPQQPR